MGNYFSSNDEDLEKLLDIARAPKNLVYYKETVQTYHEQQYRVL